METFTTSYGLITLYKNEAYIIHDFTPLNNENADIFILNNFIKKFY